MIPQQIAYEEFANVLDEYASLREQADAKSLKNASDWESEVLDRFAGTHGKHGALLPWEKTQDEVQLRPGEVTIWAGDSGSGKSLILNQIMLSVMNQGDRVVIASMEMKPGATLERMAKQALKLGEPTPEWITKFMKWTLNKLWLYDQQGIVKPQTIQSLAYYCADLLGQTHQLHYVIDSLMTCGIHGDDYNAQKDFVNELCSIAMDTGIHIHLVAHNRKGDMETRTPDKFSIAGSTDITNRVDNVWQLWRNKKKEARVFAGEQAEGPDAMLINCKHRHGESEPRYALYFQKNSQQYTAQDKKQPMRLIEL